MKNYLLLFLFLFVSVHSLFAVPAVPWAVEKVQPDGTRISVYLKGDENVNWMESIDGYTLMYDSLKYVVYAQTDGKGNLMLSNIRFVNSTKPNANITKGLRYSKAQCASNTIAIPTNTPSSYGAINSVGCPFPGTSGKTEFTDNSTPSAFTWASLGGIGIPITNIVENTNQTVSFSLCVTPITVNFTNQTVTTNTTVTSCGDINVQNVNVQNGKLTLDAAGTTTINGDFEVVLGSELEIK